MRQLWSLTYREAQVLTYSDSSLLIAICFVIATLMVPLMRKTAPPKAAASALRSLMSHASTLGPTPLRLLQPVRRLRERKLPELLRHR